MNSGTKSLFWWENVVLSTSIKSPQLNEFFFQSVSRRRQWVKFLKSEQESPVKWKEKIKMRPQFNKNIRKLPPMDNYHLAPGSQHKISYEKSSMPSICITSSHQNNFHIEGSPTRLSEHSTFSSAVEKVVTWHKANSKFFGEDRHCSTCTVFKDTHKRKTNSQNEIWKLVTRFPTHWAPQHWLNSLVVGNLMSLRYYDFLRLVCV